MGSEKEIPRVKMTFGSLKRLESSGDKDDNIPESSPISKNNKIILENNFKENTFDSTFNSKTNFD